MSELPKASDMTKAMLMLVLVLALIPGFIWLTGVAWNAGWGR